MSEYITTVAAKASRTAEVIDHYMFNIEMSC